MTDREMEREIAEAMDKSVLKAPAFDSRMKPTLNGSNQIATVTRDIEALRTKLENIARGINLLRDQL